MFLIKLSSDHGSGHRPYKKKSRQPLPVFAYITGPKWLIFNIFLWDFYYEITLRCTCIVKITVSLRKCRLQNSKFLSGLVFMTV